MLTVQPHFDDGEDASPAGPVAAQGKFSAEFVCAASQHGLGQTTGSTTPDR